MVLIYDQLLSFQSCDKNCMVFMTYRNIKIIDMYKHTPLTYCLISTIRFNKTNFNEEILDNDKNSC